jgi:hypothetical protein
MQYNILLRPSVIWFMKLIFFIACLGISGIVQAQSGSPATSSHIGEFSLGTRNTLSLFNHDAGTGTGIGGQFRLQPGKRLNTEWYFDYISSENGSISTRNDYHIGWSVMLYGKNNYAFSKLLQPYFIVGHCFDYSKVMEKNNKQNYAHRLSMATQAGIGTHINITSKLDCSLSGQYMLHFGKDISVETSGTDIIITKESHSSPEGHLLFTISFNYKFFHLWNKKS